METLVLKGRFHPQLIKKLFVNYCTQQAFVVMIGHDSRTNCARESVKSTSDSEDSNRSDEF